MLANVQEVALMVVSITLSLGLIPVPDDAERQLHPSIDDRYKNKFSGMMFKKKKKAGNVYF